MKADVSIKARAIVHRTRGKSLGPITRLMSPGDLGEYLKPFVFLDLVDLKPTAGHKGFGMHPHSGIATLTFTIEGDSIYRDSTGKYGVLQAGGVEWMRAGNGVWHTGGPATESRIQGFQLWVALPAEEENAPAESLYLAPSQITRAGPARVLLGSYGGAQSSIVSSASMNYIAVNLTDGERWRYTPPLGHTVGWVVVHSGKLDANGVVHEGELAAFDESGDAIDFLAYGDTTFVLGSAVKHPHDLVMGYYSVHTSKEALALGEAEIGRLRVQLGL